MPRKKIKVVKTKKGYLSIGHAVYRKGAKAYNSKKPNYMWGYTKGKVSKWKETPECDGHSNIVGWCDVDWSFTGRYDAKTRAISCVIKCGGINSFRNLPETLTSQLEQSFPKAKKIVVC